MYGSKLLILGACLWAVACVTSFASEPAVVGKVASAKKSLELIKQDIFFLAGEECEGRGMETEGILKAGEYIANSFKASGLKPAGSQGYFQPFKFATSAKLGAENSLVFTGPDGEKQQAVFQRDFRPIGFTGSGKVDAELVFVGFGISSEKANYDDYANVDVAGKIVVLLRRTPQADDPNNVFEKDTETLHAALVTKVNLAMKNKAAAVVFVNDQSYGKDNDQLMDFRYAGDQAVDAPVVQIKRSILEKMLSSNKQSLKVIEDEINEKLKPNSFVLTNWKASLQTSIDKGGINARNVVAVSEGSGPLADETVVIGAHYDHLGYGEPGSLLGSAGKGKVHYGADDNASGTTGLLEIARRVGAMKNRVGRRIVFIAFAAEERGLFGSIHYCKEPTYPLDKTVFMINMDMIGRMVPVSVETGRPLPENATAEEHAKARGRVVVYGTGTAEGLDEFVDQTNQQFDLKLIKIPTGTGPSDHDSFYRKKIPVLFFFTGTHKDYHRPSDTPDKINLEGLEQIASFAEICLMKYSTEAAAPKYVVVRGGWTDPTEERPARPARAAAPKLGIMPGNYESEEGGVLIEEVSPGGAAEKGGMKSQDVIVAIAGKPVKNIEDYMKAMQTTKAGTEIEVVVLRGEKKVTVKVVPTP